MIVTFLRCDRLFYFRLSKFGSLGTLLLQLLDFVNFTLHGEDLFCCCKNKQCIEKHIDMNETGPDIYEEVYIN